MYEELECGCILRKGSGSFGVPILWKPCKQHMSQGFLSKGYSKLKVVKRYKRIAKS